MKCAPPAAIKSPPSFGADDGGETAITSVVLLQDLQSSAFPFPIPRFPCSFQPVE